MKLTYKLFGIIPTTHEVPGYTVCIASYHGKDVYGAQAWEISATYWGARLRAWRLARTYAKMEGLDQHIFIWEGTEATPANPVYFGTIKVRFSVDFFAS